MQGRDTGRFAKPLTFLVFFPKLVTAEKGRHSLADSGILRPFFLDASDLARDRFAGDRAQHAPQLNQPLPSEVGFACATDAASR